MFKGYFLFQETVDLTEKDLERAIQEFLEILEDKYANTQYLFTLIIPYYITTNENIVYKNDLIIYPHVECDSYHEKHIWEDMGTYDTHKEKICRYCDWTKLIYNSNNKYKIIEYKE